ncbi:MAG: hypothetical protein K2L22_06550, partial [Muribaculaceae bacterium]|nr:hypothetical protein [Muribaculaceae bacterium]
MNIIKFSTIKSLLLIIPLTLCVMMSGCSYDNGIGGPPELGPIQVLHFKDNYEEFEYFCPEKINVDGEEQTLTLRLHYIDANNDNDRAEIHEAIKHFYFNIFEWDGDTENRDRTHKAQASTNHPEDFYHVWADWENGEPVVKASLKRNDTNKYRKLSIEIYPSVKYHGSSVYGYVVIVQEPVGVNDKFNMRIKYNGTYYSSEATHDENGNFVYEDTEFADIMREIDAKSDIQTMILEDGTVYYYDTEDIARNQPYLDIMEIQETNETGLLTKANDGFADYNGELGYFAVFEHDTFSGSKIAQSFTNLHFTYDLPTYKSLGMNDKVSSIALAYNGTDSLVCSVLTIWEDADFNYGDDYRKKHRISIVATKKTPKTTVSNLKNIKMHNSSSSWNDCI